MGGSPPAGAPPRDTPGDTQSGTSIPTPSAHGVTKEPPWLPTSPPGGPPGTPHSEPQRELGLFPQPKPEALRRTGEGRKSHEARV